MPANHPTLVTCPSCGDRLPVPPDAAHVLPRCRNCPPQAGPPGTHRVAGDVFNEVWNNLSTPNTWGQVVGWSIFLATTLMPVLVLWGANRLRPDDPLVPLCVAIAVVGGAVGLPLCYPEKGYRLPGLIAGPLFGPGVYLAFWLVAPAVMNRLIYLGLVALGGSPSMALYVFLLRRQARQGGPG